MSDPLGLKGIDVSNWQADVDWTKVKEFGVKFAFIKATEGVTFVDQKFERNRDLARQANIPCGAYHFFRPKRAAKDQAENFLNTVGKLVPGELPPVLDVEVPAEWSDLSVEQRVAAVIDWLRIVKDSLGVVPFIYMSASFSGDILGASQRLKDYHLWVAHYTSAAKPWVPQPWSDWTFWQHSNKGTVSGIVGDVDLDWFNGSAEELNNLVVR